MAVMPGAIYRPIPSKGRGSRTKGRGICLHVAVSEAASLFGYFSTASADSHFYVRYDGTIEQYVDTDLVAYANLAGNSTLISVETQGGVKNADSEPWTPAQVAALGRIVAWTAALDGYPIVQMRDSKPTSRGVGYHRLGCKPWVVAGGQLWSSATGKVCPGAAKIAQIPAVIDAALRGSAAAKTASRVTPSPSPIPKESDVAFISVKPNDHISIPRPRGGKVFVDLAFDDNAIGVSGERVGEQQVRAAIHTRGGGWRAIASGAQDDPNRFWLGTQGTYGAEMLAGDDLMVIRNLHTAWNLGVTISHLV